MRILSFAAFLPLFAAISDLGAQSIRGVVRDDSTNAPVQDAAIALVTSRGADTKRPAVRTDSLGRFIIHGAETGRFRIAVTRIGYQPLTSGDIDLTAAGSVAQLDLRIAPNQTKLGTVVVAATTRLTRDELMSHIGYELRRAKGQGKFIDSTELTDYKKTPIGMILEDQRQRFGIELSRSYLGQDVLAMMVFDVSSGRQAVCQPEVWVDGVEVPAARALDRLRGLGAEVIYGVEIYNSRQLPLPSTGGEIGYTRNEGSMVRGAGLQGQRGSDTVWRRAPRTACGAIAVWTKWFVRERQSKGGG